MHHARLATTFLATGLCSTALRAQKPCHEQETERGHMLDTSVLFASPPMNPRHRIITAMATDILTARQNHSRLFHPEFHWWLTKSSDFDDKRMDGWNKASFSCHTSATEMNK